MAVSRQSSIEFCRIVSIMMVMLAHTTFQSVGWDCSSLGILLLAALSIVGVNVFVLITGYFSTEPKIVSLTKLLFICLFWMGVRIAIRYALGLSVTWQSLFFVTKSNWFIPAYLCLLFFTPVLNAFCNTANKKAFLGTVLALIFFEVWFDLLPPHPSVLLGSQKVYSVLSFIALYLLARYIRLYGVPNWLRKGSFSVYLIISITLTVAALFCIKIGHPMTRVIYAYSNPLVILSSVSFFLMFERLPIKDNIVINHIAKSSLAVLLAHSAIFFLYTKQFRFLYNVYPSTSMVAYWVLAIAIVFVASIAVDQVRLMLWEPIENVLRKQVKQNELF